MSEQENDQLVDQWYQRSKAEATFQREPVNFVEISNIPKKMDIGSLISLIVRASRIVPKTANFCTRENGYGDAEQAVLVEFQSDLDAFMTVNKLRSTAYGKLWDMKLITKPS